MSRDLTTAVFERLKALGEHEVRGRGVLQRQAEEALFDALPQILAVVEEAERFDWDHAMVAALTALEEALA